MRAARRPRPDSRYRVVVAGNLLTRLPVAILCSKPARVCRYGRDAPTIRRNAAAPVPHETHAATTAAAVPECGRLGTPTSPRDPHVRCTPTPQRPSSAVRPTPTSPAHSYAAYPQVPVYPTSLRMRHVRGSRATSRELQPLHGRELPPLHGPRATSPTHADTCRASARPLFGHRPLV